MKIDKLEKIYPKKLNEILKPPKQIYIEGNNDLLNSISIAVIGTRHPTEYGKKMCKFFTKELVQYGITIISGMAEGIDTIAHKTCIENGGNTIAVLPCGFNNIYPKTNINLFNKIIEYGGTIVTEYSVDTKPDSKKFLERNRIVSGLSIGTLVIEAGYRSGTSVTARITIENNKPVFCVPSSLENKKGITCNEIIKKGGKLVASAEDIIEEFKDIKFVKKEKQNIGRLLEKEFADVYNILDNKPRHINEIAKKLNNSINDISYRLMMLELEEYIIELPGKYYSKR